MKKALRIVVLLTSVAVVINGVIAIKKDISETKISYIELATDKQAELIVHTPNFIPFYNQDSTAFLCVYNNTKSPREPVIAFSSNMNPFDEDLLIWSKNVRIVKVDNVLTRALKKIIYI